MSSHKQQHFVPKCHLRPFSAEQEEKSINLFNVDQGKTIKSAPVRGQCASKWFYGKDLVLENLFNNIEGAYATSIRRVQRGERSSDILEFFRDFLYLQYNRTESMFKQRALFFEQMADEVYRDYETERPPPPTHNETVRMMIDMYVSTMYGIEDLACIIIENETDSEFVTSDNPAFITNRSAIQRSDKRIFGLISAGTMLSMPLTPRHTFFCYDKDVYKIILDRKGKPCVHNIVDVNAINSFQVLGCDCNIYYHSDQAGEYVSGAARDLADRRTQNRYRFRSFVKERESLDEVERYRKQREGEDLSGKTQLLSFSPEYPEPARWCSVIAKKPNAIGYSDGSAVGIIRKAEVARRPLARWRQTRV